MANFKNKNHLSLDQFNSLLFELEERRGKSNEPILVTLKHIGHEAKIKIRTTGSGDFLMEKGGHKPRLASKRDLHSLLLESKD